LDHSGKQSLVGRIAASHDKEAAGLIPSLFAIEHNMTAKAFGEEPSVRSRIWLLRSLSKTGRVV
jgi:hypothetical protein